jgi:hypothetical protein
MNKLSWVNAPDLPTLKKDPEWNTALKGIEVFQTILLGNLEPATEAYFVADAGRFQMVLHWVIKKKWLSKHKIPFMRSVGKLYEPEGDLWYWILELCIQCHATKFGNFYRNASHWYSGLFWEVKLPNIEYCISHSQKQETTTHPNGMTEYRKNHQQTVGFLRKLENPFNVAIEPHHYRLMQASIEMTETSDRFREQYWYKFLAAYSKWIEALKKFNFISVKNYRGVERLVAQEGRGKFKKTLPSATNLQAQSNPNIILSAKNSPDKGSSF